MNQEEFKRLKVGQKVAVYNGPKFWWYVARINRITPHNEDTWEIWLNGDWAPYSIYYTECEKVYNAEQLDEKDSSFRDQLIEQIIQQNNAAIERIKNSLQPHVIRRIKEYGKAKFKIDINVTENKK